MTKMNLFLPKLIKGLKILLFTLINRLVYGFWWSIGNKVKFYGPIHVNGFNGRAVIDDGVIIGPYVNLSFANDSILKIGKNVSINQGSFIVCMGSIQIGSNTRIGEYSSIRDNDHKFGNGIKIIDGDYTVKPIKIGDNVWIGRCVTIMKGVSIGNNVVIGANSVVTKDVADNAVVCGVPARSINEKNN